MNKKILFIVLGVIILILICLFFLPGGGVHTVYRTPTLNINNRVAVQLEPKYIGFRYACGWGFDSGTHYCDLPIIPLGYKEKVVSRFCEIEYAGVDRYTIVCRQSENSPGLVPIVNQYFTSEELKSYGFIEFPKDSYPDSRIKLQAKI